MLVTAGAMVINKFPFLFGGTFIEAFKELWLGAVQGTYFPSFSEGLSLRHQSLVSIR